MPKQIPDDIKQFSYEICGKHNIIIKYIEMVSCLSSRTLLEGTYFLDRRVFCLQCGKCSRRNAAEIHRKPGIEKKGGDSRC